MRSIPYQYGERLAGATESFGRIARSAPVDVLSPALGRVGAIDAGMVRLTPPVAAPSGYALHVAARNYRSRQVGELIASALRWLNREFDRYVERRRQRAVVRATYRALRGLDSRTLRDLGMDRSEVFSVALDVARDSESLRLRAASAANGLRLF